MYWRSPARSNGHAGELILGHLAGVPVVCMKGRGHSYEGRGMNVMTDAIRTFKLLGCELQTVLAMVCMGMGITLAADSYAQTQWPGVVFRPLQERVPEDLYVVYDEKQATPAVKKLVNTLVGG